MLELLNDKWIETEAQPSIRVRIRGLTGVERLGGYSSLVRELGQARVARAETKGGDPVASSHALAHQAFCGLLEWEPDKIRIGGEPVTDKAKLVEALPLDHLIEIAEQIKTMTELSEEQEKNSASRSKSAPSPASSTALTAPTGDTATSETRPPSPPS